MRSAFQPGWWSFDLGKYRPCNGTYQLYSYESLPPLDERLFQGDFAWLGRGTPRASRPAQALARLAAAAERSGVRLPPAFVRFMSDAGLRGAVPSCTACEWDPSAAPVPCRVVPGAFTVRFLRDQQDCLFWYLHLLPTGEAHVLCSPIPFDDPELDVSREVTLANTWYCAPHFEHFVYRFWIENELWERLGSSEDDLTPAQREYVAHYAAATRKPIVKKAAKKAAKTPAKTAARKAVKTAARKTAARKAVKAAPPRKVVH